MAIIGSSDLTVQGDIKAENYIVSSSVTYMTQSFSSGATIFGDTPADDTHQFTGSLHITGSGGLTVKGANNATNLTVTGLVTGHGHSDSNNRFTLASGTGFYFYDSNGSITRSSSQINIYGHQGVSANFGDGGGFSVGHSTVNEYGLDVQANATKGTARFADDAGVESFLIVSSSLSGSAISTGSFGSLYVDNRIGLGITNPEAYSANNVTPVVIGTGAGSTANAGLSVISSTSGYGALYFGDGTGAAVYRGAVEYNHSDDSLKIWTSATTGTGRAITIDSSNNTTFGGNITGNGNISGSSTSTGSFGQVTLGSSDASADYELRATTDDFILYKNAVTHGGSTSASGNRLMWRDDNGGELILGYTGTNAAYPKLSFGTNDQVYITQGDTNDTAGGETYTNGLLFRANNHFIFEDYASGVPKVRLKIHDTTGNIEFPNSTLISGSSTSTGSFGRVEVNSISASLYQGQIGSRYVHSQTSDSATWTINHNIGSQYPVVTVYDTDDAMMLPETGTATDSDTFTLTFNEAIQGKAVVSIGGIGTNAGANYIHTQGSSTTNWRVTHSLSEQYPNVTIYDGSDQVIIPETITAASSNETDIVFSEAQSGYANFSIGGGIPNISAGNAGKFLKVRVGGQGVEWVPTTTDVSGSMSVSGSIIPDANNYHNLGSASKRWANLYTGDIELSNEGTKGNEVDGTTGSWTIQEGEDDLYLLNRKNGKKYRFKLEEIT